MDALGIPYEVDDHLVRGLDYYTHTVFEVVSTRPDSGAQATIFAGGRYDHFVEYYGGPDMSGIGFAIGMERLISLASDEGFDFGKDITCDAYVIGLGDVSLEVLKMAQELRANGFSVEANLLPRSLKSQFKSADRHEAKYVIILGEDEVKNGQVNVKRTSDKTQVTIVRQELIKQLESWDKDNA